METIGQRIFNRRIALNLTQQYIADKVGVSRVAVTKWESGQTGNLKLDNLMGLCRLLNISIEYLIQGGEIREYSSVNTSPPENEVTNDLGIETENISMLKAKVHQGVSRIPEKDLLQVKKIISTYNGEERRSKPRNKRESNSSK